MHEVSLFGFNPASRPRLISTPPHADFHSYALVVSILQAGPASFRHPDTVEEGNIRARFNPASRPRLISTINISTD